MEKRIWIFISAFGVCFAALSWLNEIRTEAFWEKGALAALFAIPVYRYFIKWV